MKKRLSLLLILCLLAMGAPALAAPGDAILLQSGEDGFTVASSFALIGDTLYALSSASLFTVPATGGGGVKEYAIDTAALATQENGRFIPANVIAAGDAPLVYGYECVGDEEDYCNFALYRVELAEGVARLTPQIALPVENMVEYMGIFAMPRQLYAPFALDGKMVARSYDAGSSIAVVDLASGELTLIEGLLPLFQWLIPYTRTARRWPLHTTIWRARPPSTRWIWARRPPSRCANLRLRASRAISAMTKAPTRYSLPWTASSIKWKACSRNRCCPSPRCR